MTDSNAESNWTVPEDRKVAITKLSISKRWQVEQNRIIFETSKTNDWNDYLMKIRPKTNEKVKC